MTHGDLTDCRFLFRLYWFPLKVLYSCGYASMIRYQKIGEMPFYFFFNSLLWVLQILNIWWFTVSSNEPLPKYKYLCVYLIMF